MEYWIKRNKSKTYSIKLNKLFINVMKNVAEFPLMGRKTDFDENVRLKIVRDYLLFYEFGAKQVKVLSIWDSNRDDQEIEKK